MDQMYTQIAEFVRKTVADELASHPEVAADANAADSKLLIELTTASINQGNSSTTPVAVQKQTERALLAVATRLANRIAGPDPKAEEGK